MKNPKSFIAATLVLVVCLSVGVWIAGHRPLWNDEYYSQVSSIRGISYLDQFLGNISEGGNAPLFYVVQKFFLQLICYQVPSSWLGGQWSSDPFSQIVLRINPILFMSLSVSLVFYYFCRRYSLWTGLYSFFIYSSSYMLWAYWAEARPYALLVFLTTVQSTILLNKIDQAPGLDNTKAWIMLAITNILLSFTSILSLGEVLSVSVLWWALKERDGKKYVLITFLPMIISLFYYFHAPKYQFFFGLSPEQLIRDNISRERFDIFFIFIIFLSTYGMFKKLPAFKQCLGSQILRPLGYFLFVIFVLTASAVVLWLFALHAQVNQGFPITSRYFIYLTPIGVMATTIVSVAMIKSLSKFRWVQGLLFSLIGLLLIQHFLKIVPKAFHALGV